MSRTPLAVPFDPPADRPATIACLRAALVRCAEHRGHDAFVAWICANDDEAVDHVLLAADDLQYSPDMVRWSEKKLKAKAGEFVGERIAKLRSLGVCGDAEFMAVLHTACLLWPIGDPDDQRFLETNWTDFGHTLDHMLAAAPSR